MHILANYSLKNVSKKFLGHIEPIICAHLYFYMLIVMTKYIHSFNINDREWWAGYKPGISTKGRQIIKIRVFKQFSTQI